MGNGQASKGHPYPIMTIFELYSLDILSNLSEPVSFSVSAEDYTPQTDSGMECVLCLHKIDRACHPLFLSRFHRGPLLSPLPLTPVGPEGPGQLRLSVPGTQHEGGLMWQPRE